MGGESTPFHTTELLPPHPLVLVLRVCADNRAHDVAETDDPDGPLTVDDRQVAKAILNHDARRASHRRRLGSRNGALGHPLPHSRLARLDPAGNRRQEIALSQDPDDAAEVHDKNGAHASAGHLL